MPDHNVIIIGGGPAGMSAAGELAKAGFSCLIIEQRDKLGGAIHRQPISGATPVSTSPAATRRWARLSQGITTPLVEVRFSTVFFGIDGDGFVLIQNRIEQSVERISANAIIVATGAVERVRPVPGWELPGVSTAGGLQVMLKETGVAPKGRVILAGNGPLLLALAAQLTKAGNPPLAIVEAGDPLRRPLHGLGLAWQPSVVGEALGYAATVLRSKTRWIRSSHVECILPHDGGLVVVIKRENGDTETLNVDRVALHNGIMENDIGLSDPKTDHRPMVIRAGDCRKALGVLAAVADGIRAAQTVQLKLGSGQTNDPAIGSQLERAVFVQRCMAHLFAPSRTVPGLASIPDHTVLCRCEARTVGDLKALLSQPGIAGREIKHNGRFGMGSCQGRFCAANTAALMTELRPDQPAQNKTALTGARWPVRPVSIASLANATSPQSSNEQEVR